VKTLQMFLGPIRHFHRLLNVMKLICGKNINGIMKMYKMYTLILNHWTFFKYEILECQNSIS